VSDPMLRRKKASTRIPALAAGDPRFVSEGHRPSAALGAERAHRTGRARLGRVLAAVLAALLLWAWAPQPAEAFHKYPKWKCGYHWTKGKWHRKKLIKCQAERKGLSARKAIQVARCESGLNPSATGGGGLYLGLFQQHSGYWPERAQSAGFGGWSAYNGRANAFVSLAMAASSGWTNHWPVCGS
jgi:hypothetical protein